MIDIHTHLIPNIDDGAKSVEETFDLFKEASSVGFTDIILTPHYIANYYENKGQEIKFWVQNLQKILDDKNINITLHAGMEIYILSEIDELIKSGIVIPLANTKYVLMEIPMHSDTKYTDNVIFLLQTMGYKVVLAHPERYECVQNNPNLTQKFIDNGCILQSNFGSILGVYGRNAEKTIKKLLKLDLIHVLASDCHRRGTIYANIPSAIKKLEKIIPKSKLYELTEKNPRMILNNEDI